MPFGDMPNEYVARRQEEASGTAKDFFLAGTLTSTTSSTPVQTDPRSVPKAPDFVESGAPNDSYETFPHGPSPTEFSGSPSYPDPSPYETDPPHRHPHKEWDGDADDTTSVIVNTSVVKPVQDRPVDQTVSSNIVETGTFTSTSHTILYDSTASNPSPTSSAMWYGIGVSAPPPLPPNGHHSPLKLILLGAFLGAGFVLSILGCLTCARRIKKNRKKARSLEGQRSDAEVGPSMQMVTNDGTGTIHTIINPINTRAPRVVDYASTEPSGIAAQETTFILNPFSDPTYNASSGVEDYVRADISHSTSPVIANPFSHPDDPDTELANHPRPNSEGDFPPEYMTIDDDAVAGMGVRNRETRFPFGDDALSDLSGEDESRSLRAVRLRDGYGDGFRGYTPRGGLGADIGEGMGEGVVGYVPDSDASTITESRRSIETASVRQSLAQSRLSTEVALNRESAQCPATPNEINIDEFNQDYVCDGFGYRPGMRS